MLFLILDPSLYDWGGHNLDYVLSIKKQINNNKIKVLTKVFTNCKFDTTSSSDSNITFTPYFEYGMRDKEKLFIRIIASTYTRICKLISNYLKLDNIPIFEPLIIRANKFFKEIKHLIKNENVDKKSKILLPTLSWADAMIIAENIEQLGNNIGKLDLIIRFDPPKNIYLRKRFEKAFKNKQDKINIWCDTVELVEEFTKLTGIMARPIRIPCNKRSKPFSTNNNIIFLGESRIDKGFQLLPEIISKTKFCLSEHNYKYIIQILENSGFNSVVKNAADQLRSMQDETLKIIEGPLASEEFKKILEEAQIILCLHDGDSYKLRSAGLITQSLYIGIPIVMDGNSSSSLSMINRNKCNDIAFICDVSNTNDVVNAIKKAIEHKEIIERKLDCVDDWSAPWLEFNF